VPGQEWYGLLLAVAIGDYSEADRLLGQILSRMPNSQSQICLGIGEMLFEGSLSTRPIVQLLRPQELVVGLGFQTKRDWDSLMSIRALLALEAGQPQKARKLFEQVWLDSPSAVREPLGGGDEMARYYLEMYTQTERGKSSR
jgi:hypothetical protein